MFGDFDALFLLSASHSKFIRAEIARNRRVALDPLEQRLVPGSISLVDEGSYLLNEVLVQHGLAIGFPPVVLLPRPVPVCRAIDGVFAVGKDSNIRIPFGPF